MPGTAGCKCRSFCIGTGEHRAGIGDASPIGGHLRGAGSYCRETAPASGLHRVIRGECRKREQEEADKPAHFSEECQRTPLSEKSFLGCSLR